MGDSKRTRNVLLTALASLSFTMLAAPGFSNAEGERPAANDHLESHRQEQRLEKTEETRWRAEHESLSAAVVQAQARLDRALAAYSRSHGPTRGRGGARERAAEERDAAQAGLAAAEANLEVFMKKARRAGVPPGWLRPADTQGSEGPASQEETD